MKRLITVLVINGLKHNTEVIYEQVKISLSPGEYDTIRIREHDYLLVRVYNDDQVIGTATGRFGGIQDSHVWEIHNYHCLQE